MRKVVVLGAALLLLVAAALTAALAFGSASSGGTVTKDSGPKVNAAGLDAFRSGADECATLVKDGQPAPASQCLNELILRLTEVTDPGTLYVAAKEAIEKHPEAFRVLCHRNFHYIGEAAGKKYPTVKEALAVGGSECEFGFDHGVIEGHASVSPTVWEDLPTLCEILTTDHNSYLYQECSHGLGHAVVTRTDNDVPLGIEKCRLLQTPTEQSACATGIFMSWSNTLDKRIAAGEDLDGKWAWADPNERWEHCPTFDDVMAGACVLFFSETTKHDHENMTAFRDWCVAAFADRPGPRANCHLGIGRVAGAGDEFNWLGGWPGIIKLCMTDVAYEDGRLCMQNAYGQASGWMRSEKVVTEACKAWEGDPNYEDQCALARDMFEAATAGVPVTKD